MGGTPTGLGINGPTLTEFYNLSDTSQLTAASATLRTDLQIMANNQDLFVAQMAGKTNIYASNPDNPVLGYQLALQRPTNAPSSYSQSQVSAQYQTLLNELPMTLRVALENNSQLPPDQQNEKLTDFGNYLMNVALVSLWFDSYSVQDAQGSSPPTLEQVKARMVGLGNTALNALQQVSGNVQAEKNQMPVIDPQRVVLGQYLKMIQTLLLAAEQFLEQMQGLDAKMEQKDAVIQMQDTAAKLQKELQTFSDQIKAKKKQASMQLTMKIVGPILAALAVLAAVATGGAGAILVALVFAALTAADSATGFMSQGLQTLIGDLSDHMPKWAADLVVTVMIVLVAFIGGGAASVDTGGLMAARIAEEETVSAEEMGMEVSQEAIQQAVSKAKLGMSRMMGFQIFATGMSSSGILTDVANEIGGRVGKAFGADSEQQQIIAMIMQMLMMLTLMAAGGGGSGIRSGSAGQMLDSVADVVQVGTQGYSAYNNIQQALIRQEMYQLQGDIAIINAVLANLKTDQDQLSQEIQFLNKLTTTWAKVFNDIIKGSVQTIQQLTQAS